MWSQKLREMLSFIVHEVRKGLLNLLFGIPYYEKGIFEKGAIFALLMLICCEEVVLQSFQINIRELG